MILIISNSDDLTTGKIILWLNRMGVKSLRINADDYVEIIELSLPNEGKINFTMKVNELTLDYNDITSVYYRKGRINIVDSRINNASESAELNYFLAKEVEVLHEFILYLFEQKNHVCSFSKRTLNKLMVLDLAKTCGLKIPDTYITGQSSNLKIALNNYLSKNVITKNIYETISISNFKNKYEIESKTYKVNVDECLGRDDKFLYSLFQKEIPKNFEIRSFYVANQFFSSAILSHLNDKTKVDFRNYDLENPNKILPYDLPKNIEIKLRKLFELLNLNSGSVDLIFSQGEYFFFGNKSSRTIWFCEPSL
jgi:ATP-GRASP peptide maturase of grasp-with-spasm system